MGSQTLVLPLPCWSVSLIYCFFGHFPTHRELREDRDHVWLTFGSEAPSAGLDTGRCSGTKWMNCVAQEASFWSNSNSILLTYVVLSGAVLGESWYFQALIVGLQKPRPASPLFPYSNVCADLHLTIACGHPLPVVWDEDHSLVCALTNIWLFMELSRGPGKLGL